MACLHGHTELIEYMITSCKMNIHEVRDNSYESGKTTLQVDALLEQPGCTVFHMVTWLGNVRLARILLQKGAQATCSTIVSVNVFPAIYNLIYYSMVGWLYSHPFRELEWSTRHVEVLPRTESELGSQD